MEHLFIISFRVVRLTKEEIEIIKQMKKNICYYAVCLFLTFTICIYAPFELYLTNQYSGSEVYGSFFFSLCALAIAILFKNVFSVNTVVQNNSFFYYNVIV